MNYLISVIIPVFNVEVYLHRCINSILNQTYKQLEIIIIDDGSFDNSPEICNEFAAIDSRIQVIHKSNGGLSSARNAGIDIAKGDFIGFVDSDDFIENDMYEQLLYACIENNADISMSGRFSYNDDNTKVPVFTLPKMEKWSGKQAISKLLIWNNIDSSACDKLFRKELFINIRFPHGKVCEDVSIIPRIISMSDFLVHIGEAKYYYYQRSGSISRSEFSMNRMHMLESHKEVMIFVITKFPDLKRKAESFYFHAFLCLYLDYFSTNAILKYPILKPTIDKIARYNFLSIMTNTYVLKRNKFFFILIYLKIYAFIKKLKSLYKPILSTNY